jgi:hypothetical protein
MEKKYIKKLNIQEVDFYIKDSEAIHSINDFIVDEETGKLVNEEGQEVAFASTAITLEEIDSLFK